MPFQEYKRRLIQRKMELERQQISLQQDLSKEHSHDFAEQAQERENDDVLTSLKHHAEAELAEINQALLRMEQGVYAKCTRCGANINPARLEALPATAFCVNCSH
ncbi:TraR/DksA C4-type zinc finger protein [Rheinheimera sp. UJ51]|uniref:TraR/DksA family transcriptional regulator n=1 Tax=unclassified Rheinheimera TaxID=115860 RepID=UPI001E4AF112|nr:MULTISPECIES: TraR/DksA C4-type zinc finger protein [unclassified Rheinheimera]MCC5450387.1 TraR/DksA C4-type zinc finger protein [Rheinheimera sp. UJ51]MCF4009178.1 TraR/DksA C4-type zinc finger protein [Rheinheimera sp. UJ63]